MNSVEISSIDSSRFHDLQHVAWKSYVRIKHHSEILDTLCWWDLISKNTDWEDKVGL